MFRTGNELAFDVYWRTSPWPNTTYFSEVKPSSPTGPRACSLSFEMPISAPNPYSKPSAKRVEALIITEAESTSRGGRGARGGAAGAGAAGGGGEEGGI